MKLQNVSLDSALKLMLEKHNIIAVVKDEVLFFTSVDYAEQFLINTRVYPIPDHFLVDAASMMQTIHTNIEAEKWEVNGGPGSISEIEGAPGSLGFKKGRLNGGKTGTTGVNRRHRDLEPVDGNPCPCRGRHINPSVAIIFPDHPLVASVAVQRLVQVAVGQKIIGLLDFTAAQVAQVFPRDV